MEFGRRCAAYVMQLIDKFDQILATLLLRSFRLAFLSALSRLRWFRFSFLALRLAFGSFSGCGGLVASVFSFSVWRWVFLCAAVSCLRFVIRAHHAATSLLS